MDQTNNEPVQQTDPPRAPSAADLAEQLRQFQINQVKAGIGLQYRPSHRKKPHHKAFTKKYADGRKAVHEAGSGKFAPPQMSAKALARAKARDRARLADMKAIVIHNENKRLMAAGRLAIDSALGVPVELLDGQAGTRE